MKRFRYDSVCARGIAALALLYLLNAFVQSSDWLTVPELLCGLIWLCACSVVCRWLNVWAIVTLSFAASVAWGFLVESQPVSDFLNFHRFAGAVAAGDIASVLDTKSPPTVAFLAAFQAIFGSSVSTNYLAGAFAWSVGCLLIYKATRRWGVDERGARFVCAIVALYPSFVVYAVVPSSEGVVFLLTGMAAWLLSRAIDTSGRQRVGLAALVGLTIGMLYLTRMNSVILLLPALVILGLVSKSGTSDRDMRFAGSTITPLIACVAGTVVVVAVFGSLCLLKDGEFRVRPSRSGDLLLLFGTNTESNGGFNRADAVLIGWTSDDPHIRAGAPAAAREMALQRVLEDIPRFIRFALTTKVERLWRDERPLNSYSIGGPEERERINYYLRGSAIFAGDSAYRIVSLLFLGFLVLQIRRPTHAVLLGGVVLLYALPHILIEVQPRYHVPMIPFMIAGAAVAVYRAGRSARARLMTVHGSRAVKWLVPFVGFGGKDVQ